MPKLKKNNYRKKKLITKLWGVDLPNRPITRDKNNIIHKHKHHRHNNDSNTNHSNKTITTTTTKQNKSYTNTPTRSRTHGGQRHPWAGQKRRKTQKTPDSIRRRQTWRENDGEGLSARQDPGQSETHEGWGKTRVRADRDLRSRSTSTERREATCGARTASVEPRTEIYNWQRLSKIFCKVSLSISLERERNPD